MNNLALSFSIAVNVNLTHEQLVSFFSAAELHSGETFDVFVDDKYKELKHKGPGDCYEDHLVNTLVNGGSLCVVDIEDSYDEQDSLDDARRTKNSLVLDVVRFEEYTSGIYDCPFFAPVYEITLDRISKAFQEILTESTTCEDKDTEKCLIKNYQNTFVNESGDYFDAWNLFQYIVFGDLIYE